MTDCFQGLFLVKLNNKTPKLESVFWAIVSGKGY